MSAPRGVVRRRPVLAWLAALLATAVAAAVIFGDLVSGTSPVLVALTASHGVHLRDLPVVAAWLVVVLGCLAWGRGGASRAG